MQENLTERTYRDLRRRLLGGGLKPGAPLVIRQLAIKAGVSLAPVREAINRLSTEGLVEQVPGGGAFVRRPSLEDLEELYVLREALEACAAGEAASHATALQLEEIDAVCRDSVVVAGEIARQKRRAVSDALMDRWLANEERFHAIILGAARNRLLRKVVADYRAMSRVFEAQRHRPDLLTPAVAEETCREHAALARAIRKGNPELSRRLASEHVHKGRRAVMSRLRDGAR